jgi:hypothetical protein
LAEAEVDLAFDLALMALLPVALLATYLAFGFTHLPRAVVAVLYALFGLAFIAYQTTKLRNARRHADAVKAGFDAELAVGQELDQLMRKGAYVYHDVPADGFNIDHVVVARQGLFAIETKGFTKVGPRGKTNSTVTLKGEVLQFPTFATKEPLEQASRQVLSNSKVLPCTMFGAHDVGTGIQSLRSKKKGSAKTLHPMTGSKELVPRA